MSKIERLVNLLAALIETDRPLSRHDLHERVPGYADEETAFRRTFERDKDLLRSMGVPIVTLPLDPEFPDHGDGYRVLKDEYYLPDPQLSSEEMSALGLAASAVKLQSQSAAAALWKLGGAVDGPAAGANVELPESQELGLVFAARRERRSIQFQYKGKSRTLDPHRLTFRGGHWYVNGLDHEHQDVRTYRLDRMEGGVTSGPPGSFEAPARVDQPWLPPWRMGDEAPVTALLAVDEEQAGIALDQAGTESLKEKREDGSVVLQLEVTNREAFRSFALGFLDHAEVLGPKELRDDITSYLHELAAR